MSIVVTGASGHLGRRVVELLLDAHGIDPRELILVTRNPDRLHALAERGAQVRAGDFDRPGDLPAAFAGGTRMLLISADEIGRRIRQHTDAVAAAKAAGVAHVAYTSYVNTDVEGNPSAIAPEHHATEVAIRDAGLTYTFLRNSIYAEVQVPDAAAALATGKLVTNAGDGRVAYVSREDCAAVAAAVLARPDAHQNAVHEVTGPELIDARTRKRYGEWDGESHGSGEAIRRLPRAVGIPSGLPRAPRRARAARPSHRRACASRRRA